MEARGPAGIAAPHLLSHRYLVGPEHRSSCQHQPPDALLPVSPARCRVQGPLLSSTSLADSRTLAGSRGQVQSWLRAEHRKFRHTLWRLLAQHAPSARR